AVPLALCTRCVGGHNAGNVWFDPPLPERKREAIERLGVGSLCKIVLRYEEAFWPKNQYVFGYVSERGDEDTPEVVNLWKTHRIPALAVVVGGAFGSSIEAWSENE